LRCSRRTVYWMNRKGKKDLGERKVRKDMVRRKAGKDWLSSKTRKM
jgi:hypothetical protein